MRVADVARRVWDRPIRVAAYESAGALPPAAAPANGYREYDETDVARLQPRHHPAPAGPRAGGGGSAGCGVPDRGAVDLDLQPLIAGQRLRHRAPARRPRPARHELDRPGSDHPDAAGRATQGGSQPCPMPPIRVLFVCTGNSARSQLAEALLQQHGGSAFEVHSAGHRATRRQSLHHPRALAQVGIDWSAARSKSVDEFLGQPFDYVITVCDRARQSCPVFPGSVQQPALGPGGPGRGRGQRRREAGGLRADPHGGHDAAASLHRAGPARSRPRGHRDPLSPGEGDSRSGGP